MSNGNSAAVIGTIDKIQELGHREDYIVRVLQPSRRYPEPKVELKVWVDNQKSNPTYQGLSSKGGYFRMTIEQFNQLVDMAPAIREAVKAATPEEGAPTASDTVPGAPNLDLLAGVVGR